MEEKKLKILAVQMSAKIADKKTNFSKIKDLIDKNITDNVDVLILPELWPVGWKPSEFKDLAENFDNSKTVNFLSEIAKKYNTNIIGGSLISEQGTVNSEQNDICSLLSLAPSELRLQVHTPHSSAVHFVTAHRSLYNACPVINRKGELIAVYEKMHLFSYYGCDEGKYVQSGENPVLVEIDGIKIGLSICYDIRFPEIYRAYRRVGADLLINMAAWPKARTSHWDTLTKARAIENQCYMVALTQCGLLEGDEWNSGHSRIIDYNGEIISELQEDEGIMCTEIKFEEMYKFREKCTVLLDIHDKYEVKWKMES
ncbi:MAG: hypothetical protein PHC64_00715 [Candidatus Gastranaerophilales bacterium]|nr:hypothetical protein [Candidatus Gastranaerophilales bacterium]